MANWATKQQLGDPSLPEWQQRYLKTIEPTAGQKFTVFGDAAPAFEGFLTDLAKTGYPIKSSGGFNYRNMRGSDKLSQHAFGNAIDLNALENPMGSREHNLPGNVGQLAAKHGLEWGGVWDRPDPMHFEWRGPQQQQQPQNAQPETVAASSLLPPLMSGSAAPDQAGEPQQPLSLLGRAFGGDEDWLRNDSYSSDALISDFFGGKNPLKRKAFQLVSSIFGI